MAKCRNKDRISYLRHYQNISYSERVEYINNVLACFWRTGWTHYESLGRNKDPCLYLTTMSFNWMSIFLWYKKYNKQGSSRSWIQDLSHPKRKSYPQTNDPTFQWYTVILSRLDVLWFTMQSCSFVRLFVRNFFIWRKTHYFRIDTIYQHKI